MLPPALLDATEEGNIHPELPQALLDTTKNGNEFLELIQALLDTSNKHGIINIVSAGGGGLYSGHAL